MEGEKPKSGPFKSRILKYSIFFVIGLVAIFYLLDEYIFPSRVGIFFTKGPEYSEPVPRDEVVGDKEEPVRKKITRKEAAGDEEEDIASSPIPEKPKLRTVTEMVRLYGFSFPGWVMTEWNINIERGKGKKIAKALFGNDEIEDWNADMLGERNASRLKKGIAEFIKKDDGKEKGGKTADAEKESGPSGTSGESGEVSDTASETPSSSPEAGQGTGSAKNEKKPERTPLSPYDYALLRFMPGLDADSCFIDYEGANFEGAVQGKPDFIEKSISKPEVFKNQYLPVGNGGSVTFKVSGGEIVDGDGPDFVIYGEPAFGGGLKTAKVEVASADNPSSYVEFTCESVNPPYRGCAGVHKVDPSKGDDPLLIGGDPFDLSKIGVKRAKYIRITDTGDNKNSSLVPYTAGFNVDSISLIHAYKQ